MTIASTKLGRVDPETIEDVQGSPDSRQIPINKVGIRDIRHPVRIRQRSGGDQHTVATFSMFVDLPHHFKGTHMSRFVQILHNHDREITVASFRDVLHTMTQRLEAHDGHIEMAFTYFMEKAAPATGVKSLMDYQVTFHGEQSGEDSALYITVQVPVTTLCPCSKSISRYGAHNQRSHVRITAGTDHFLWLEELIELAESEASCELYGVLKRSDEKLVTERAYDNPKFVEDLVRDVAGRLNADERVRSYAVESENFESIHNHSAFARIEHDKDSQ